ncbi:MAG: glycosyltransferase family 2 protein [Pseudomonadota bacterium]
MRETRGEAGPQSVTADPLAFLSAAEPTRVPRQSMPAGSNTLGSEASIDLPAELAILQDAGVERARLEGVLALARRHQMQPAVVAIRSGVISHQSYLAAIAASVGAHVVSDRALQALKPEPTDDAARQTRLNAPVLATRILSPNLPASLLLAPGSSQFGKLVVELMKMGPDVGRIILVTPESLRRWLIWHHGRFFADEAEHAFKRKWPLRSASQILTATQSAVFVALFVAAACALFLSYGVTSFALHALCTLFFTSCVGFRIAILASAFRSKPGLEPAAKPTLSLDWPTCVPVYTVLVAVHDEANQAADLVRAMANLRWPQGRLEVKFITEANDQDTVQALRAAMADSARSGEMEVLVVPHSQLRTKPRALNYALPITSGEYVVLYDAEDRPDPDQLMEAHSRFQSGDASLACLQSPLAISNGGRGFISMMFALEYAALFKVFLPAMARMGLAFPLGGTSNHFRRSALEEVGAWDPHNVTEDADLGLRLARHGYYSNVLTMPTYEEAPVHLRVWIRQRTRWLKGWAKTWLIHMREPAQFVRQAGGRTAAVSMVLFGGTLLAALLHPWIYILLILLVVPDSQLFQDGQRWLLAIDIANVGIAMLVQYTFVVLAVRRAPWVQRSGHGMRRWWPIGMPLYWLLATWAAWRALGQLFTDPHGWEKTPHGL